MMKKLILMLLAFMMALSLSSQNAHAARSGGTFHFIAPYGGDLSTLDPHKTARTQDWIVLMNINRCLYAWSAKEGRPVPSITDQIKISKDRLTYTYTLKKGILFHNGRELVTDDVIWSYHRIMDPKTVSTNTRYIGIIKGADDFAKGEATQISGLKKVDNYTLSITLKEPVDPAFSFSEVGTAILPKEEVEKRGDNFGLDPVGCGPFKFVKWVKGSEVILTKFDRYYEPGKPYLDKVVYKIMSESAARDIAFKAGELDATIVGSVNYPQYKKDPKLNSNLIEVAELWTRIMCFNMDYGPFKKKEVRQAMNHAINSPLIIKKLLKGKAFEPVGYLPPTSPGFNENGQPYEYSIEKAKALLKDAGYPDGFTVECLGTDNGAWGVKAVEATIPMLKKVGITIKPVRLEGATMAARANKGDFQALIWSISSGPDPLTALGRWESTVSRQSGNYSGYNNPEYDKLLTQAKNEQDEQKKLAYLKQADKLLLENPPGW
ncbi:MAG: ABC transporter substrate-binding protein, partial [Desulfobacteraceae bacterium]|nr:ABC transporter substrate-binding protein [Desulfobacteraceae bacterium]